jgi:tight adherence protein B
MSDFESRWLALACVASCVLLAGLFVRRAAGRYEQSFVRWAGGSLRQRFIVADARTLFIVGISITITSGSIAYGLLGPLPAAATAILGFAGPTLVIKTIARRRARAFVRQLPDALLAVGSALRAGSTLIKGFELLATRHPAPLSQEFTIVVAEHRIGRQLAESLADMRRRMNAPELDLLSTAVNVSRRVGGNLADTLEALGRTLREKAQMEGKIDALTSMGRAQGWVVSLLPVLICAVLYQQQPERMALLFTEWYGWLVLGVVGAMMAIAAWMIRRIVNIDV